ncbi:MAG: hypothetical protein F4X14_12485 [Caldilineaceae bacterium SB0661_bin_32]|uniref:Uncharacterized protein n=1 Tax=Caldilineaceae bacterium SB0661_bin_32 TaxID=2605255 RepID=A0A6B1D8W5_9CHLR|nr:hypothetical protein [Caldilineaceae bacterium SB0661_bin_32]
MSETIITSVAEFHEQLRQRATGAAVFLYRGQAEAAWPVSCSAARRLTKDPADPLEIENRTIQSFYQGDTLWSWEPAALGNRIVAQSSVFVLGVPAVASDMMDKFIVRAESKDDILAQLESVYGISEEMLFSDFPGFAVANAANKSFDINDSMTYWLEQLERAADDAAKVTAHSACGLAYADIGDDEKAQVQYVAARRIAERMQGLSDETMPKPVSGPGPSGRP